MRGSKILVIIMAFAVVLAACQAEETAEPTTQPPSETTMTTMPPTTSTTTPPETTTTTTVPLEEIAYLPAEEPAVYQVWGTTAAVVARELPGTTSEVVGRFASTARDIKTTGRRAEVAGLEYLEIDMPDEPPCWMSSDVLVHQIEELAAGRVGNYVVSGLAAGDRLNVRSDPGTDHPILTSLAANTTVKTTGLRAEVAGGVWAEVEYDTGTLGWVSFRYLVPEVIHLTAEEPAIYRVTGLSGTARLNVREGPGVHESVITSLAADATDLQGTGKRATVFGALWREIELASGKLGWVSASYIEVQPEPICRPGGDTFCPNNVVSRGMAAAFVSRALGLTDDGGRDWFWDDTGSPFETEINRLAAAGILQGCDPTDPGKVCDEQPATRRTVAILLSRALGLTDDGGKDWFTDDNGLPGEVEINRLAAAGIARGCTADKFCPEAPIVRGQMAAWIDLAFDLPVTTQDFWTDDDGSLFEDAINRVTAAGIAYR